MLEKKKMLVRIKTSFKVLSIYYTFGNRMKFGSTYYFAYSSYNVHLNKDI